MKLIFVLNLATKQGETDAYQASDFLKAFLFYLDAAGRLDFIIANEDHLDPEILEIYKGEGQGLVEIDEREVLNLEPKVKVIKKPVSRYLKKEHLLRHDPQKLAEVILSI